MHSDKELIIVRKLQITDIYRLNRLYDSLSVESKCFFHPGFLGFKSISPTWLFAQIALAISFSKIFRSILISIYPPSVILSFVSTNKSGKVTGFAFIKIKEKDKSKNLWELGIFVRDDLRGKHIGSSLMQQILLLARKEKISNIYLTALSSNFRAISTYKKYGFIIVKEVPNGDSFKGKKFNCYEMILDLSDYRYI